MFISDRPINSMESDFLGRAPFAGSLGEAMLAYEDTESLVVGLYGSWGSGKTSIINLLTEYINGTGLPGKSKGPVLVNFNPWYFSGQDQIIPQFFGHLASALKEDRRESASILREKLLAYRDFFMSSKIASGEIYNTDFHHLREEIDRLFLEQPRKFIMIVDDIDRLDKGEILKIFQLMKVIANFPRTIYIASFDKDVVINALNLAQQGTGVEYLEKIIQVPFEIPLISQREVEEYLLKSIAGLLKKIPSRKFDNTYWGDIFHSGFRRFFTSIRDVARYINALRFSFDMIKRELNVVDYLVIVALQVFAPRIYSAIRDNKELFAGLIEADSPAIPREREQLTAILGRSPVFPDQLFINLLGRIFPRLDAVFNEVSYEEEELGRWRQQGKVCTPEIFDTFFRLSVPEGKVSRGEIEEILMAAEDPDKFAQALTAGEDKEKVNSFLLYLVDSAALEIPEAHRENVIAALMDIGDFFLGPEPGDISALSQIIDVNHEILSRIDDTGERFRVLKNAYEKAQDSLYSLVKQVDKLYIAPLLEIYEFPEDIPESKRLLEQEQAKDLMNLTCGKIEEWALDGRLARHEFIGDILAFWMKWIDHGRIAGFVKQMIESDSGLLEFISGIVKKSSASGVYEISMEWELTTNIRRIEELSDLDEIVRRLRRISSYRGFANLDRSKKFAVREFLRAVEQLKPREEEKGEDFDDFLVKVRRAIEAQAQIERERDERVKKGIVVGEEEKKEQEPAPPGEHPHGILSEESTAE